MSADTGIAHAGREGNMVENMIEKMAETIGVSPKSLIMGIIFFVIAVIVLYIKTSIDEKKGVDSKEKEEIRKLVNNLVPDGHEYTAAYAHSKEVYGSRSVRREIYHYYAVGFHKDRTDHLWVIPIGVEKGEIVYTQPMCLSVQNVSYIGGNSARLEIHFPESKNLCILSVDASNTKMGKECQVNIQQPEEAKEFIPFAEAFQSRVNDALGVDRRGRKIK